MKTFDRLKSWIRAMEDIEDLNEAELKWLRERMRILEERHSSILIDGKRGAR